jgi:hypothetical protein
MKRIFLLSACLLTTLAIVTSCGGGDSSVKKPDAPERQGWSGGDFLLDWIIPLPLPNLYGDVESVTITGYGNPQDRFGEIVKGKGNKSVYIFNERGDVISVTNYNLDGSLWDK